MITKKLIEKEVETTKVTRVNGIIKERQENSETDSCTVYDYNGKIYKESSLRYLASERDMRCSFIHEIQAHSGGRYINRTGLEKIPYEVLKKIGDIIQRHVEFKELLDSDLTNDK